MPAPNRAPHDAPAEIAVLIVGAGPTGLTLACELARGGVAARLIETEQEPRPGSRGKGVQPRSLEVFEDLGIVDQVMASGRMAIPMYSTAPDGQVTRGGVIPASLQNRPDIPYAASLITPQWRVEEALRRRLEELGGTVEFGTSLVGFRQADETVIADVTSRDGTETIVARWLIGCDGGHSTVRKYAEIGFVGESRDDVRVALADLPLEGLDRDAWQTWPHPEGLMSLCPLPSTELFQYAANIAPGDRPSFDLASLQTIVERRTGRTNIRLAEPAWSSVWRANVRLADRYRDRGVFVAGDAAHVHSPAGGQGMNTGIQDAHNLAWKLVAVAYGRAAPSLLDTYEAERRPIAAHVLALSNRLLAQTLKTHAVPIQRDASTIQLDVGYRGSPLAHDDRRDTASLRAGDRAPDATGLITPAGTRRLFDLLGSGRFILLAFGAAPRDVPHTDAVRVLRVVQEVDGVDQIGDPVGQLKATYLASDNSLVLVRPDGYVGLISDAGDVRAVRSYIDVIDAGSRM